MPPSGLNIRWQVLVNSKTLCQGLRKAIEDTSPMETMKNSLLVRKLGIFVCFVCFCGFVFLLAMNALQRSVFRIILFGSVFVFCFVLPLRFVVLFGEDDEG